MDVIKRELSAYKNRVHLLDSSQYPLYLSINF